MSRSTPGLILCFASLLAACDLAPPEPDAGEQAIAAPPAHSPDWMAEVGARIRDGGHRFLPDDGAFVAEVRERGLRGRFDSDGASLSTDDAEIQVFVAGFGRAGDTEALSGTPALGACIDGMFDPTGDCVQRLEIDGAGLRGWWMATEQGFEQGWTVDLQPAGEGPLVFDLDIDGAQVSVHEDGAWLQSDLGGLVRVSGILAWDADGAPLATSLQPTGSGLRIAVDDRGARFPIEVDPYYSTATWQVEGAAGNNPIGGAIAVAGDVNGDGYDDVIIGADSLATAYVYHGSATGLSSRATTVLTGTTDFGAAVAGAGDVDGDGYDDVLVGEPTYSTYTGRACVFHGSASGVSTTATSTLTGPSAAIRFGYALDSAGDVNADGYDDIVVGAHSGSLAYVFHGSASGIPTTATTSLSGSSSADAFGKSVAGAGDINGDGYDDIVVGAPGSSSSKGRADIFYGSSSGISSSGSTSINGSSTNGLFGCSVDGAGDVDGDGYREVVIGSYGYSSSAGQAFIYAGSASGTNSAGVTTLTGTESNNRFGYSVSGAGDVNGDGYDDIVIGEPSSATSKGLVYIYQGSLAGLATTAWAKDSTGSATSAYYGTKVAGGGDLNGDGYDDILAGAIGYGTSLGRVYTMAGGTSGLTASTQIDGVTDELLGYSIDGAGDVNGDGYDDVIVGAPGYSYYTGQALVYHGSSSGLSTTANTTLTGTTFSTYFGKIVAGLGDVDADGYDDVVVGAPSESMVYVFHGSASGVKSTATSSISLAYSYVAAAGDVNGDGYRDLALGTTSKVYLYHGSASGISTSSAASFTVSNTGLAPAGDLNSDGYDELLVGYSSYSTYTGEVFVYYGSATGLTSTGKVTLYGYNVDDYFGSALAGAGDVNGDGYDDVVVGAWGYSGDAGRVYFYHGSATGLSSTVKVVISGGSSSDMLGITVGAAGDIDSDGYDDVMVSASGEGQIHFYPGSASGVSSTALESVASSYTNIDVAGDVSADGLVDLIGSSYTDNGSAGLVVVYEGYIDADGDGYPINDDCDDTDATISGPYTAYADTDGDGFGDPDNTSEICGATSGYVDDDTDCDDSDSSINPDALEICDSADTDEDCSGLADDEDSSATGQTTFYADTDGDGYGDLSATHSACDPSTGWVADNTDCDDGDSGISPGAQEICDAADTDEDCDGLVDDADSSASGQSTWYADDDGDGYGGAAVLLCDPTASSVATSTDCDDTNGSIHPGATELCDAADTDEDCDGLADDLDSGATGTTTFYLDADGDGYGGGTTGAYCDLPSGYVSSSTDCDDSSAAINPSATEICDAADTDEDCDGLADDLDTGATGTTTFYLDSDGDGYGGGTTGAYCDLPSGYAATSTDCDDSSAAINPSATEICDAADTDEDCDGLADDLDTGATGTTTWYTDTDGDGFGSGGDADWCDMPAGYAADSTDCDDTDAAVNPDAQEICDPTDTDEDCDGLADDADSSVDGTSTWYVDADGDGYGGATSTSRCDAASGYTEASTDCDDGNAGVHPDAAEIVGDEVDGDCDGGEICYADEDEDGYRGLTTVVSADDDCADPGELSAAATPDCDDSDATVSGGSEEVVADGIDEDCDGFETCYLDADGDGYRPDETSTVASDNLDCTDPGEADADTPVGDCDDEDAAYNPGAQEANCIDPNDYNCDGSVGYADNDGDGFAACEDCDDSRTAVNPDAEEVCNGRDDDCDGEIDLDAVDMDLWYADLDEDGFVDLDVEVEACDAPEGYVAETAADCDDDDAAAYPGATEVAGDGIDQDCDGQDLALADDDTGGVDDTGGAGGKAGCGCTSPAGSAPSPLPVLLGLGLLAVVQRRRRP